MQFTARTSLHCNATRAGKSPSGKLVVDVAKYQPMSRCVCLLQQGGRVLGRARVLSRTRLGKGRCSPAHQPPRLPPPARHDAPQPTHP